MATLVTDPGLLITDSVSATVEVSSSLDPPVWTLIEHLFCDRLTLNVNAYDEAELVVELGEVVQPGSFVFTDSQPLDILGYYVRITVPQPFLPPIVWYGFIVATANERSAVKGHLFADKLTGRKQVLRAVGLEYFLDRVQIDSAYVAPDSAGDPIRILRSIPFNGGQGVSLDPDTRTRENRSESEVVAGVYGFVPNDEEGDLWTLKEIIDYIIYFFSTRSSADDDLPLLYVPAVADTIDAIAPTIDPEGMTAFQVLNKLLSPQRGYVWWLEVDDADPADLIANLRVETLANAIITLPTTGTIPANADQQSLDLAQQRDVEDLIVSQHGSRIYHQIICRGARMTSTCTLGNISTVGFDELITAWTTELEADYQEAAIDTDGYDDLSEVDKKKRNDAFRNAERFYSVYGAFRLSPDWDGKSGDGADPETNGAERDWTFPVLSDTGSVLDTLAYSTRGLRLLNYTRLKRGWGYQNVGDIEETQPENVEAEYMPLFGIVQVSEEEELEPEDPGYPGTISARYQFVEKLSEHDFKAGELVSDNIGTSYSVAVSQTFPGVILNSHGLQHTAALTIWSGEPSNTEPEIAYDTLRVTCTLEADTYCEGRFPADADLPPNVPLQKLVLYAGEEYRLDFLAQNTVVDLENGEPVLTNGGVLRDDRKQLADLARVAYEWYRLDRLPITVQFRQISNLFRLGMLITNIGEGSTRVNCNTVVSVIDYNLKDGVMTIKTNDEDLDLARVV